MLPVAALGRTYQQALSGTPTAPAIPVADIDYVELWLSSDAAFDIQFDAADDPFTLAANTVYRLRVQRSAGLLVSGTGTLSIVALGSNALAAG
jgi:hypothetical protein